MTGPIARRPRRLLAALGASALAAAGLGGAPTSAQAADRTITLVGSLQSELGCSADWAPDCAATVLARAADGTYGTTVDVPRGSYEYKIAVNGSWDESYGAGGAKGGANIPLVLAGPARLRISYDDTTHQVGIVPLTLAGATTAADKALARDSLRADLTRERFYFLMADRFANGDPGNDTGGITGGRLANGFDPTDKGFYHGGDLAGVIDRLDYIKGMGTTAIWLTPSFTNRPVQGAGVDASAGYHGYWTTDFTSIDPHLGGNEAMKKLVAAAHAKGMKVFFDIIANHTADVIDNAQKQYTYVSKAQAPYKDAAGNAFDDATVSGAFPVLDPATSFPYTPVLRTEADRTAKTPAWLNDVTMYHNRGDSTYEGESATYGDFSGLDDLFTERPEVVKGMTDIYSTWAELGIDGYRIDTVKHVNLPFWQQFAPAVLDHAHAKGTKNFFMFGEVYDASPATVSRYTTTGRLQAALDFPFQGAVTSMAQGKATTGLRDVFADDDYYTDTDSNAYELPTFTGNHDMGRLAMMLTKAGFTGQDLVKRLQLATSLQYLTRGQPVTYYGDEQGFIGAGGDKDARQDLFATKTAQYANEPNAIGPAGSRDRYDTTSVLYRQLADLARLRTAHPALADGAQVHRYSGGSAGIYAFSRIDRRTGTEYVVAVNNATTDASATFATYERRTRFAPIHGGGAALRSGKDGRVSVTVPALSARVWRADAPMPHRTSAPAVHLTSPGAGGVVGGRAQVGASLDEAAFAQVTFAYRPVGTTAWTTLGTDDNAPYRVFHDVTGPPKGELVEYRAVAKDASGNVSASSTYGVVGDPAAPATTGGGVGPVAQPDAVSVPGSMNKAMGCAGDWAPDCAQAQLTLDPKDQVWKGTATVPAGDYSYKVAIDTSWDENYGAGGAKGGANIAATLPATPVTWYYDHATHYVTTDAQGPIITAPGSFQKALGCGADWAPDCMRPWLQDPDGDGTYTWSTDQIPAGTYDLKIAHGLSWDENYGADGKPKGDNISFTVPANGVVVTISYRLGTHQTTVSTSTASSAADLTKSKAIWVDRDTIAWPAASLPAGVSPSSLQWRLAWAPNGGLATDAETISAPGSSDAVLRYDPAGINDAVVAAHPELKGYVALQLDKRTAAAVPDILRGQIAVGMYDAGTGRLLDATSTQVAYALDDLYGRAAASGTYGVSFAGDRATFRVWAPTAQTVRLLTWPAGSPADAPVDQARATTMRRAADGSWSASLAGARDVRYVYEVTVYAPATKKVEKNLVTDPASVALTPNSTRSVAVDLRDPRYMPQVWRTTPSPRLDRFVDATIYELHVRDFSVKDSTVPAAHRGSYLAFADEGAGTKHLRELAKAGLNTVHLLPTFDIATIQEDKADQAVPGCDLAALPADSTQQQDCIAKIQAKDGFNWGYDPFHWSAPEGSYASSPAGADGGARVAEFRTMVGGLHRDGLRVVLDQVFNHTNGSGQTATSVLDKVVPGYYHRLDAAGAVYTSTCCQNVATEHTMANKALIDSVITWARGYKVDGFRFDLMGHHSAATMTQLRAALDRLTVAKDGVDGRRIHLYGEGWNFGEVTDNALFRQATQGQLGGTGIGTFSDRLRDAVRGGTPFDEDPRVQGFGTGLATDPNASPASAKAADSLGHVTDLVQLGLAGNLKAYTFTDSQGRTVRGDQVDYKGRPAGYADQPDEVITYVDAHDNETLFDALTYKLPVATSMADRVRMNTVALATTALAQTPSFWHAGADMLRSKSLDRDSYDSGDWFNAIDWTGADNGFGHGMPMRSVNEAKYPYIQPLLANPALKPAQADVQHASAMASELLRLRFSTPLMRLGSASLVQQKVSFPASGTAHAVPGVVAMRIDDTVGPDVDRSLKGVVVVINASPKAVTQVLPGMAGHALRLSPVQADGVDPVVKTSTVDAAAGSVTVPARTVAVFVE